MRTTKIVATLGPASESVETIRSLCQAGVDVFRLNASHGNIEERAQRIHDVRRIADECGKPCGVLLDLQGPKIRLGTFEGGVCTLQTGAKFTLTTEPVQGNNQVASTTYTGLANDVKPGDRVLLADGAVELRVLGSDGKAVRCEVVSGGQVGDRKGINLPGVNVSTPSMTRKDMADLQAGLDSGIDLVALSFVRKPADLLRVRLFLEERDAHVPVIAKIEKPEAWDNLDAILAEADGVMVARGDLGVEMALEKVPYIQKQIIQRARQHGKFVITATQMLESMIENPVPTRAEVSDIANAIYDGTDAVMLSAETSTGRYPVDAVRQMARIAEAAEVSGRSAVAPVRPQQSASPTFAEMVAEAASNIARSAGVAAVVVFTSSGAGARLIARYRPAVPVYAITLSPAVARQLSVIYGVVPIVATPSKTVDEMVVLMDRVLQERALLKARDSVVFVAGQPVGHAGTTNLIKLHRIGESDS